MKTYLISDLHLGNAMIRVHEPDRALFSKSVEDMNAKLIKNWNEVVKPNDVVYHLGDFVMSANSHMIKQWADQLNGHKIWIKGNHGDPRPRMAGAFLRFGKFNFLLIHNPNLVPFLSGAENFDGWTIHGHTHSSTPYIDCEKRRVNVCVEVIDYRPKLLDDIIVDINDMMKASKVLRDM